MTVRQRRALRRLRRQHSAAMGHLISGKHWHVVQPDATQASK